MNSAIVIGAGLSGLTAAYRLKQGGWQVTVLEKADRICGRVITREKNGYILDCGATAITETYVEYIALLRELGLGSQLVEGGNLFGVVRNGAAYCVDGIAPIRSFLGTKLMSWPEKLRSVIGALKLRKYMADAVLADPGRSVVNDHLTINDVVSRSFGATLNDTLMDPIMRVISFCDVRETTAVELFCGLSMVSGRNVNVIGGMETLPQALARHVSVKLGSPAHKIEKRNGKVEVTYDDSSAGSSKVETVDACVISCPFPDAVAMCPQLGVEAPLLAKQTKFASCLMVHLGYAAPTVTNPAAIALPRKEFPNNQVIFLDHNKAPDRAPKGHSLFTLYYCTEAVARVKVWPEGEIIKDARGIIERYFPEVKGHLDMTNITLTPYVSHLAPPGYFKAVQEFFANHLASDPIQVGGDYFSLPCMETAVVGGNRAARRIIDSHNT